jgi:hypothetical protein
MKLLEREAGMEEALRQRAADGDEEAANGDGPL